MRKQHLIALATAIAIQSFSASTLALTFNDIQVQQLLAEIKANPSSTDKTKFNTLIYTANGGVSSEFLQFLEDEIHAQNFEFPISINSDKSYQFSLLAIYNRLNGLRANQRAMPSIVLEPVDDYKGQYVPVPGLIKPGTPILETLVEVELDHTIKASSIPSFIDYKLPGLFAVPGENITVKVEVLSGSWNGRALASLRVNQHTDDLSSRSSIVRAPTVSASIALTPGEHTISSAYGGLISITNQQYNNNNEFKTKITIQGGVVEAPVYKESYDSPSQFAQEAAKGAPWGILEGKHIAAIIPAHELIDTADHLEQRQQNWERVIAGTIDHMGLDNSQAEFSTLDPALKVTYVNDIQIKTGSWHSGYPIMAGPKQKLVSKPVHENAWTIAHEIGHNFHTSYRGWKIEKSKSTEVSNNLYATNHQAKAYLEGDPYYSRLVFDNTDRFLDAYNILNQGNKYGDKATGGVRLVLYRQLQLADPEFFKKLNQEVLLQLKGIHFNEKTTKSRLTPVEFMVKYGSPILGYSLVGFVDYWGVAISDEIRELVSNQFDEPVTPVQFLFEDINFKRYVFNPENYDNQVRINELAHNFPADAGWITYNNQFTNEVDAPELLSVIIDGEPAPVCRFNSVDQENWTANSVFGFVKNSVCTIGDYNSLHGVQGASSINFQVVDLMAHELNGEVAVTIGNPLQTAQLCFRHQAPWTGLGYSLNGKRCSGNMTASNGNGWSFSSRNQMLSVQKEQAYSFPDDQAWVIPSTAIAPLNIDIQGEKRTVCRMHYKGGEVFGFAAQNTCAVDMNNSVEGIVNYSSSEYQVIDTHLATPGELATTTLKDGQVVDICYRKDGVKVGVGYSLNKRRCQSSQAQMKAFNGGDWTFSSGNKFITF